MFDHVRGWIDRHHHIAGVPLWLVVILLTAATAVVSVAASALAVVYIPPDYFVGPRPPESAHRHPVLRWTLRIARNLFGWFLVFLGVLLSFPGVPGQGLLTILIGLMLVEFPGKRRCEQALIRRPRVHAAIDSIRRRFGHPPLILDDAAPSADGPSQKDDKRAKP